MLNEEKESGTQLYLVETVSTLPIHNWYLKPSGWVLMHREEYMKLGTKADFKRAKQILKNPLANGDSWHWKGKGMLGVDIEESNDGPRVGLSAAGKFYAMKVTTKVIHAAAPVTKTYWYAPAVGLVKSMTNTGAVKSTTELLVYSGK